MTNNTAPALHPETPARPDYGPNHPNLHLTKEEYAEFIRREAAEVEAAEERQEATMDTRFDRIYSSKNLPSRLAVQGRNLEEYLAALPNHGYSVRPVDGMRWRVLDAYGNGDAIVVLRHDGTFTVRLEVTR